MLMREVKEEVVKARQAGKRFLVVCLDLFDYYRFEDDYSGYYYPAFETAREVVTFIESGSFQLGIDTWRSRSQMMAHDACLAVVDLAVVAHEPAEDDCVDVRQWLATARATLDP